MARRLTAHFFSSIDGVVSNPFQFQYDSFDAGVGAAMDSAIGAVDDVILGRVTYSEWAGYWPTQAPDEDASFANFINPVRKHVASRTLTPGDLAWNNSTLIDGDLLDFVRALKETEGRDITVTGSITVTRQLLAAGLVDALMLTVHPAVAGAGVHLFDETFPATRYTLLEATITEKGNALLTYGPRA